MTDQKKPIAATKDGIGATRPPLPRFTGETAILKVRLAEYGWNSLDLEKVSLAYAVHSAGETVPIYIWKAGNRRFSYGVKAG